MKKMLILALTTLLSANAYSLESSTNTVAFTLAQTVYTGALGLIVSRDASRLGSSKESKKLEALQMQEDVQDYLQTGRLSIYLQSKLEIVKDLDATLSMGESIDLLIESSNIILAE